MKTIDIHAHLLSKNLKFERPIDKILLNLFGKSMGLRKEDFQIKILENSEFSGNEQFLNGIDNPMYRVYIETLIRNIRQSKYVDKSVLFSVDSIVNSKGVVIHTDPTVCSDNEDVNRLSIEFDREIIPFFSINPNRLDALDLIDEYYEKGFKGAKFLPNQAEKPRPSGRG